MARTHELLAWSNLMGQLQSIAGDLDISVRTLRRAIHIGVLRGEQQRRPQTPLSAGEERYARRNWSLLGGLRAALRTEPGVAAAILFGSVARGEDDEESDLDLVVQPRHAAVWMAFDLEARLEMAVGRAVHVITLSAAERAPILLDEILRDGRPLVDRDGVWAALQARRGEIASSAARQDRELATAARRAMARFLSRA